MLWIIVTQRRQVCVTCVCNVPVVIENLGMAVTSFSPAFFQPLESKSPPATRPLHIVGFFFVFCFLFGCALGWPGDAQTIPPIHWIRVSGVKLPRVFHFATKPENHCVLCKQYVCQPTFHSLASLLNNSSSETHSLIFPCRNPKSYSPVESVSPSGNSYHSSYFTFLCDIICLMFFVFQLFFKVIFKRLVYYDSQYLHSWCLSAKKMMTGSTPNSYPFFPPELIKWPL